MRSAIGSAPLLVALAAAAADAQEAPRRFTLEGRGGFNVPTFDISDAVDGGPSVGVGLGYQISPKLWALGDVDLGSHSSAKLGYAVVPEGASKWSVIVNAGAGALTFDVDGGSANTYPAINVGAKIAYRLGSRVSLLLSPQGDIAFTDEDEVGT